MKLIIKSHVAVAVSVTTEANDCTGTFNSTVTFSSTRDARQCVSIYIRGDDVVEEDESFSVTFSSVDERDVINAATTYVTIVDDDGVFACLVNSLV